MASPDITYAGQIVAEAPEIQAYKLGLLKAAKEQVAKPITLPAYQAAGLSDLQQTAAGAGKAYADIGQGVGAYAPFMQSGANLLGGAGSAFQEAGKGIAGINVAPQYQLGQQGMLTAAQTAANISPYVDLMGAAYKNIGTGSQTLGAAQQGLQAAGATAGGISPYAQLMGAGYANIGEGTQQLRGASQGLGGAEAVASGISPYAQLMGAAYGNIGEGTQTLRGATQSIGGAESIASGISPYAQRMEAGYGNIGAGTGLLGSAA